MKYSEKLNGYWEEGYHYYVEIRNDEMTVLDYHRRPTLKTKISYDCKDLEKTGTAEIVLDDGVLSRAANGEPMTMIKKLTYIDGRLELDYFYTIMGPKQYTLNKVDHGPFDYLTVLDGSMLGAISGRWVKWEPKGRKRDCFLDFNGDNMKYTVGGNLVELERKIHVCSVKTSPDDIFITPANLAVRDFGIISEIKIQGNMLTTYMHICDADAPLMVFMREKDLDVLSVPEEATRPLRMTMFMDDPPVSRR